MEEFKISYDENEDILYLAKEGLEHEILELSPGVNLELDDSGKLIGCESPIPQSKLINKPAFRNSQSEITHHWALIARRIRIMPSVATMKESSKRPAYFSTTSLTLRTRFTALSSRRRNNRTP